MKLPQATQAKLRDLRQPLVLCAVLCAISIALLMTSVHEVQSLIKAHAEAEKRVHEASRTTRELSNDLDNARKFLSEYDTLVRRAVIGDFEKQRSLDQVDHLMQAGWVEPRTYALAAQATLDKPEYGNLNHHQVVRHSLSFEVKLPHELRLVELLEGLTSNAVAGLTTVESCEISRAASEQRLDQKTAADANRPLSGRCTLNWYRFALKSSQGNAGAPGISPPGLPGSQASLGAGLAGLTQGNGGRP